MQSASSAFDAAAKASARVLADPRLLVDWAGDGVQDLTTRPFMDDFNRREVGQLGNIHQYGGYNLFNLGTFDPTRFNVTPGRLSFTIPAVGTYAGAFLNTNTFSTRDFDTVVCVEDWGQYPQVNYFEPAAILGRVTGNNSNYYMYRGQVWWTGEMTAFMYAPGGANIGVNVNIDRYWHPGDNLYVRACAIGTTHMMKVWSSGEAEPPFWDLVVTDTTFTEAAALGIRSGLNSAITNTVPITFNYTMFQNYAIDEMSHQLGENWSVNHALYDGMPDEVSSGAGSTNFGQFTADLGGRKSRFYGGSSETAGRFFSQFNTKSPVWYFDRDIPPVTLDTGLLTANGQERVRLFTGQMTDIQTDERLATMGAVGASNRKLQNVIQPPPIIGDDAGLTSSWPVSYALARSGLYISPPYRSHDSMLWAPMHGSLQPMWGGIYRSSHQHDQILEVIEQYSTENFLRTKRPQFVDGPFLEAAYAECNTQHKEVVNMQGIALEYTNNSNIFCQQGSKGRFEFWVRTDPTDTTNPPGGGGSVVALVYLNLHQFYNGKTLDIKCGLNKSYQTFFTINDGSNTQTFSKATPVPQDGQWHFVGIAWDMVANTVWEEFDNVTVSTFTGSPAITTANLPPFDIMDQDNPQVYPQIQSHLPIAEVQITSGSSALPTNAPWVNDAAYWDPSAASVIMTPGQNRNMVALAETAPIRAIDLIQRFAQAELAMTRSDELDRFCYLPMPYWATTSQQTQVDTYTAKTNIMNMQATRDITRIRNSIVLQYKNSGITQLSNIYTDTIVRYIAPERTTRIYLNFPDPAVYVNAADFLLMDASPISDPLPLQGFLSFNTQPDGSGNAWNTPSFFVTIIGWDAGQLILDIQSNNLGPLWLARADGGPVIGIAGKTLSQADAFATAQNDASIARRGVRGLSVSYDDIQDAGWAQTMASELSGRLAQPRWRVDSLDLVGDHRRQPGDLVRVQDKDGTALDGLGRVMSIQHTQQGSSYTQTASVVQAWTSGVWGESRWDQAIWGA